MIKRVEVLVHAGAPSGRKDDDRYKAQAEAYVAFQGQRIDLTQDDNHYPPPPSETSGWRDGRDLQDETTVVESASVFLEDTQLAITALDSQLLTSSLPIASGNAPGNDGTSASQNLSLEDPSSYDSEPAASATAQVAPRNFLAQTRSFAKRKRDGEKRDRAVDQDCGADEAEVRVDAQHVRSYSSGQASSEAQSLSSYLKTPILDHSTKRRRLEQDKKADAGTAPRTYPAVAHGSQNGTTSIGGPSRQRLDIPRPAATAPAAMLRSHSSLAVSEPISELPTSYSLSDITSESSRARIDVFQRSASDRGPKCSKGPPSSAAEHVDASTVSGSNGTCAAGGRTNGQVTAKPVEAEAKNEIIVISDDTHQRKTVPAKPVVFTGQEDAHQFSGTDAENPAPSQQSQHDPGTSSSKSKPLPLPETYEALRTLSISIYPPEPKTSIGPFTTHITPALASLASDSDVADRYRHKSLSRDIRPLERGYWLFDASCWPLIKQVTFWQFLQKALQNGSLGWGVWCTREGREDALGQTRVFCWGEVVRHVYLVLYVASSSQVRKLGLQWVDAEGEVVVQM